MVFEVVLVVTFGFEASGVSSSVMVVSTTGSVKSGNSGTCDDCQTLKPPASTITAARHPAKAFFLPVKNFMDICSFHIIHTFLKADVSVSNLNRILGIKKAAYSNEINGRINTQILVHRCYLNTSLNRNLMRQPAVIVILRTLDPWLCVPVFQQVCLYMYSICFFPEMSTFSTAF